MNDAAQLVDTAFEAGILTLKLNRPEKANAITCAMLEQIMEVLDEYLEHQSCVAVVFTGAGDRIFSGGADLAEMQAYDEEPDSDGGRYLAETWDRALDNISTYPLPTIALINGACIAGGLSLALACDLIIGLPAAYFSYPRLSQGHLPGEFNRQHTQRRIGVSRSKAFYLAGQPIGIDTAVTWGLSDLYLETREAFDEWLTEFRSCQREQILQATRLLEKPG